VIEAAFRRGAVGYIVKRIDPTDLAAVIRQVVDGNVFYPLESKPIAHDIVDSGLTGREADILKALADGLSNKQIARQFWLSEQTIKFHLTNIYRKLGVSSRTEAVRHAYERGLIENPILRTAPSG
jgi:DNA-binding NarL/FixJ family response regulator